VLWRIAAGPVDFYGCAGPFAWLDMRKKARIEAARADSEKSMPISHGQSVWA
jgi:hypothetical protein